MPTDVKSTTATIVSPISEPSQPLRLKNIMKYGETRLTIRDAIWKRHSAQRQECGWSFANKDGVDKDEDSDEMNQNVENPPDVVYHCSALPPSFHQFQNPWRLNNVMKYGEAEVNRK